MAKATLPQSLDWLSDQLVFVHLDITCWSGKKTLTPEDLGLDRARLPPETLVSLGDKQLVDPDALRTFTSLRGAAHRHCLAVGTRFLGGYAVPVAKASALLAELDALGQRYRDARATFLAGYDDRLAAWAGRQPPEWQKMILDALVPAEYVGGRLSFDVQAARFAAPDPAAVAHDGLNRALTGLGDQVFHEVGQLARETLERSFQGKGAVTRRALGPLASIRDKLHGLAFLDGRFRAVVGEIDRLMASVPAQGPIAHGVLAALTQFLSLAAQPDGLRTWAANAAVWRAPPDLLGLPAAFASPLAFTTSLAFTGDAGVPAPVEGAGVPPSLEDAGVPAPVEGAGVPPSLEDAGVPVPVEGAGVPPSLEDAGVPAPDEAAADPLTAHLMQVVKIVDEVRASVAASAGAAASIPPLATETKDSWFF